VTEAEEIEAIRKAIRKHISDMLPVQVEYGTVKKVDWDAKVCDVEDDDGLIREKVLISINKSKADVKKPEVGSRVLVGLIDNQDGVGFLVWVENFEEWHLNGDKFGGLPNWLELQKQLEYERDRVDGIIKALNSGVAAAGSMDGGTALIASIKALLAPIVKKANYSKVESKKIKHG
jgi:hypothetical protein